MAAPHLVEALCDVDLAGRFPDRPGRRAGAGRARTARMAAQMAGAQGLGGRCMRKMLIWLPLALFLGFFGLFASGLLRPDDRIISSKLVGKPLPAFALPAAASDRPPLASRSDEHTSELQSLMRTPYAVFCLTK